MAWADMGFRDTGITNLSIHIGIRYLSQHHFPTVAKLKKIKINTSV